MKNLFDPAQTEEIKQRILSLHANSQRQWGAMALPEMLAHCTAGIEMAMKTRQLAPAPFPARVLGRLIKPFVLRDDAPMRRNAPAPKGLLASDAGKWEFEPERASLIAAVDGFARQGPAACTGSTHPFFGPLTPQQWAILMYKHLDHHLRQFSV